MSSLTIAIFGGLYLAFILWSRKMIDFKEYAVASKNVGTFLIFCSLCASMIGPAYTLGFVSSGHQQGIIYYLAAGMVGFNYLIMSFLAPLIYNKFPNAYTIGDLIAGKEGHNSNLLKVLFGLLIFVQLTFICTMLAKSIGVILLSVFGWPEEISIPIAIIIITAYSFFGGIKATMVTDMGQLILFCLLIPGLILAIVFSKDFNASEYVIYSSSQLTYQIENIEFGELLVAACTWLLLGMLGGAVINKVFVARSSQSAKKAYRNTAYFMFIWMFLMVILGDLSGYVLPNVVNGDGMLTKVAQNYYNETVFGIFIVAILGVIMSSQDTLLNATSVIFTEDVIGGITSSFSDKKKLIAAKLTILIVGVFCIVGARYVDTLIGVMVALTSVVLPAYLPSAISTIVLDRPPWYASLASMITGLSATFFWRTYFSESLLPPLVFGLLVSSSIYVLTYLLIPEVKRNINSAD